MFFISVPKDEGDALDTCGTNVRINGKPQTLYRVDGNLTWTDQDGKHVKPILMADEVKMEVCGRVGLHSCISFTCGDEAGQRLHQDGLIGVLLYQDEARGIAEQEASCLSEWLRPEYREGGYRTLEEYAEQLEREIDPQNNDGLDQTGKLAWVRLQEVLAAIEERDAQGDVSNSS